MRIGPLRPYLFAFACLGVLASSVTAPAFAGTTGSITGSLIDTSTGKPIAGASVKASSPSETATATTDASGNFVFLSLQPDTYTVTAEKSAYDVVNQTGVSVFADQTQRVSLRTTPTLKTIATVRSQAGTALVRPGTTANTYSVDATTAAKVSALGGGGSLNQAYSAIATVPGVYVPSGASGWSQAAGVVIRGGTHTQVGYEYDGVPVNLAISFFPAHTASSLGQQEVQAYTGGGPPNSESQGLSGFVNQVIKTGTYPGYASGDLAVGTPTFYHKAQAEAGGATPDRIFSYYIGVLGANQDFRIVDNFNGAGYTPVYGLPAGEFPCPNDATSLNFASCYNINKVGGEAGGFQVGPGGFIMAPISYGYAGHLQDRENVVNLRVAIPHKNSGIRDSVQLLWQSGGIDAWNYSSQSDLTPQTTNALFGGPLTFLNGVTYAGPVGAPLPANYASLIHPYFFPTIDQSAFTNGNLIPTTRRDVQQNDQGIVKLQYQHNMGSNAYVRLYGYTVYSDFILNGATSFLLPVGLPPDYEVVSHTRGLSLSVVDQIGSHLLQLNGGYLTATTGRTVNLSVLSGNSKQFAVAVNSNAPQSGICYNAAGGPASCEPRDAQALFVTLGQSTAPALPSSCGGGPCEFLAVENGGNGPFNQVTPRFASASLTDNWNINDKFVLNYGVRMQSYTYIGADTNTGARPFWFNAYNQDYCVSTTPGSTPVTKAKLGILDPTVGCSAANGIGVSYISPTLTNGPANYTFVEWEPRVGATYTLSNTDVLRASWGKFTQPAETGFVQYNGLQQNIPATLLGPDFYKYGFTSTGHAIPPQESFNTDLSWEHAFKGTDISMKITPFYRKTRNELTEFFIIPAQQVTSGLAVGSLQTEGAELQIQKGDFARNGFAALFSYAYTNARVRYSTLPNGGSVLSPINNDIRTYNAYTSFCASNPSDTRCGGTTTGAGAAACFTPGGAPDAACAAGDIANPYWNAPVQSTLDPNGSYWPTDPVVATTSLGVNSYTFPNVATLTLNYRHNKWALTPSLQFQGGQHYGAPETNTGIDPAAGCSALTAASVTGDPRYPYGGAGGAPFDALTCNATLNAIPNVFTGKFDSIGEFVSPSQLLGSLQVSYNVSPRITVTANFANVINQCFGGSKEPWTGIGTPHVCSYVNGEVSRLVAPAGNVYNPGATFQPQAVNPYFAYFGPYTMGNMQYSGPFTAFFDVQIKL